MYDVNSIACANWFKFNLHNSIDTITFHNNFNIYKIMYHSHSSFIYSFLIIYDKNNPIIYSIMLLISSYYFSNLIHLAHLRTSNNKYFKI